MRAGFEEQRGRAGIDHVGAVFQALAQRIGDPVIADFAQRVVHPAAEPAGRADNDRFVDRMRAVLTHFRLGGDQPFRWQADQCGNLRQYSFGKIFQPAARKQVVGRVDNLPQSAPAGGNRRQLVVGADRRGQRGNQAGQCQLGLGLVIVDVVVTDCLQFRRIARLAGAQHDTDFAESKLFANHPNHSQARILGFHHHVEEDQRDVAPLLQHLARFRAGIGVQEFDAAPGYRDVAQRKGSGGMHIRVVVHDQHRPVLAIALLVGGGKLFFGELQRVIVVLIGDGHAVISGFAVSGAISGNCRVNRVPADGRLRTLILPPRTRVTML